MLSSNYKDVSKHIINQHIIHKNMEIQSEIHGKTQYTSYCNHIEAKQFYTQNNMVTDDVQRVCFFKLLHVARVDNNKPYDA